MSSKSPINFSKGWFLYFAIFGAFCMAWGIFSYSPFEFVIGGVIIATGYGFRKASKTLKTCSFCISPIPKKASVCAKCGRDQKMEVA